MKCIVILCHTMNALIAVENKAIQWNAMHASGLEWMGGSWNHLMGRQTWRQLTRLCAITVFVFFARISTVVSPMEKHSAWVRWCSGKASTAFKASLMSN